MGAVGICRVVPAENATGAVMVVVSLVWNASCSGNLFARARLPLPDSAIKPLAGLQNVGEASCAVLDKSLWVIRLALAWVVRAWVGCCIGAPLRTSGADRETSTQ